MKASSRRIKSVLKKKSNIKSTRAAKPTITDFEAHIHPDHIPMEVIKQSIEHGIFDDVEELETPKTKHNLWRPESVHQEKLQDIITVLVL